MITLRMEVWDYCSLVEVFEKRVNYLTQRNMNQFIRPLASKVVVGNGGKIVITAFRRDE